MELLNRLLEAIMISFGFIMFFFPTVAFVYVTWLIGKNYLDSLENITNEITFKLKIILFVNIILFSALGFSLGFFLPLKFSNSPQGPLLGIFCTGPLGAFVGYVMFYLLMRLLRCKK